MSDIILKVNGLTKEFKVKSGSLKYAKKNCS